MAKVFLNGCFDVLQPGHINMLMYARWLAKDDKVIVALDEDDKVMIDKGIRRPIFSVAERAKALYDLRDSNAKQVVDKVEFFQTNQMLIHLIKKHRPEYLVKGSDWEGKTVVGEGILTESGEPLKVMFYPRMEYSTTDIIKRVLERNKPV